MKYKPIFFALIMALTISLTGCFPTGEKPLTSTTDSAEHFSGKITEKVGSVEMNYYISADFPAKLSKIRLKNKEFDYEQVESILFRGKELAPRSENVPPWVYEATDGSELQVSGDSIFYFDTAAAPSAKNFDQLAVLFNKYSRAIDAQLSSFPSSQAIDQSNKILDELGIENFTAPYVVPITAELVNGYIKNQVYAGENADDPEIRELWPLWDESVEFYVLRYRFSYNGIELCDHDLKTPGQSRTVHGSYIDICVSKDGIFSLSAKNIYDVISWDEGNVDIVYDAKYASDKLVEYYTRLAANVHMIEFTDCRTEYVPIEWIDAREAVFAPAWCFMGYRYHDESRYTRYNIYDYYYFDNGRRYGG